MMCREVVPPPWTTCRFWRSLGIKPNKACVMRWRCGVEWEELPGEGAFYGPKIEYHVKMLWVVLGSAVPCSWTSYCRSVWMTEYVTENNDRCASCNVAPCYFGFIGALHRYSDWKPCRLIPIVACSGSMVIMNITENQADYCREVAAKLQATGFRVELDLRNEKIGYKIRDQQPIPFPLSNRCRR